MHATAPTGDPLQRGSTSTCAARPMPQFSRRCWPYRALYAALPRSVARTRGTRPPVNLVCHPCHPRPFPRASLMGVVTCRSREGDVRASEGECMEAHIESPAPTVAYTQPQHPLPITEHDEPEEWAYAWDRLSTTSPDDKQEACPHCCEVWHYM